MAKKKVTLSRCFDCSRSYLMRSNAVNPIVAECEVNGERQVASTLFPCEFYKQNYDTPVIHEMKRAK